MIIIVIINEDPFWQLIPLLASPSCFKHQTKNIFLFTSEKAEDLNYNMCFLSNNNLSESGFCIRGFPLG